ncbi:MAG: peptidoglycan DD-metalloendopeptidase family protein [Proteobacteria bacterium]|nr:peptidoglycan DD-metalloendopeptidase family protein [Pseudomonadota bacterium]
MKYPGSSAYAAFGFTWAAVLPGIFLMGGWALDATGAPANTPRQQSNAHPAVDRTRLDAKKSASARESAATETKTRVGGGSPLADQVETWLDDQLHTLDKTRDLLIARQQSRRNDLQRRVRGAYKQLRSGVKSLWFDPEQRSQIAARVSAVRRVLARDLAELALLDDEMSAVSSSRQQIAAERNRARQLNVPEPGSLRLPVAWSRVVEPFGVYRHARSRARLSRRGIWLSSRPGRNARAVAAGEVLYVGLARGLGHVAIIDHGDYTSILGTLTKLQVSRGESVETGDLVGESMGDRVYLEIRLDIGPGGFPVDPQSLIAWP